MTSVYNNILKNIDNIKNVLIIDILDINNVKSSNACLNVHKWIIDNNINKLIVFEPVKDNIWHVLTYLKDKFPDMKLYGVPMIDITRKSDIDAHNIFDIVLCSTMTTYSILKNEGLSNLLYVGWCVDTSKFYPNFDRLNSHKNISEYPKARCLDSWKLRCRFFHNAGWGGSEWRKNTESVVLAFNEVCKKMDYVTLHIHTQKPINEYPESICNIIKTNNNIKITEGDLSFNEVAEMTRSVDVSVLPSRWEGLGIPLYESLACGVPVITVDNYPMNEIVSHNHNGLCCEYKEVKISNNPSPLNVSAEVIVKDLTRKMCYIADIDNRDKLYNMSMASIETIKDRYTINHLTNMLKSALGLSNSTVLFIAEYYYPFKGGAEKSIHNILRTLKNYGYNCFGMCYRSNNGISYGSRNRHIIDGIEILTYPKSDIGSVISEVNPDIILTQLNISDNVVKIANKMNIPSILFIRSFAEIICGSNINNCDKDLLECNCICNSSTNVIKSNYELFENVTSIIANSKYSCDVVEKIYNKPCDILYPTFESVNIKEYNNNGYILFIKPTLIKGVKIVIDIARKMNNKKFLIVGEINGAHLSIVNSMCNIIHIPHIDGTNKMNELYSGASVVIVPSIILEGFGRVPIEAMLNGVPVISSSRGGLKESNYAGIVIQDYNNIDEWVMQINRVLDDKDYNKILRDRCLEFSKIFIYEPIDIINIIEKILDMKDVKYTKHVGDVKCV